MWGPGLILVGYYFQKRKGLAYAVACAGQSVGILTVPFLVNKSVDYYGFQGTMVSSKTFQCLKQFFVSKRSYTGLHIDEVHSQ